MNKVYWLSAALAACCLLLWTQAPAAARSETAVVGQAQTGCERGTFPNYHNEGQDGTIPAGYDGPIFELSQAFPDTLPAAEDYPWLAIDFVDGGPVDPAAYIDALRDYAYAGNWEADWYVQNNPERGWYHVPWLDYGENGREFVHGMTHELDLAPGSLGPEQTEYTNTWAVAVFNDRAGWAIGQMWCDPANPQPDMLNPNQGEPNWFPDGSMIVKLLFSTIDIDQGSFMEGAFAWTADIYDETVPDQRTPKDDPTRSLQQIRLLQIDLAVRDSRSKTGWLFGTLTYDGRQPGNDPIAKMLPVGIQWGNDPGITPEMIANGAVLQESWINDDLRDLPSNHLGWGGRVAGPADNPGSSCMSCHMTAGVPAAPILPVMVPPTPVSTERYLNWFLNIPAGVAFGYQTQVSLDYSLEMSMALQNFHTANQNTEQMAAELYSPRGPERDAPAALLTSGSTGPDPTSVPPTPAPEPGEPGGNLIWIIVALGAGLLAGAGGVLFVRR